MPGIFVGFCVRQRIKQQIQTDMATQEDTLSMARGGGPGSRGVSRVLGKLRASIEAGNFYEAHQMYRTLHFRYASQERYDDLLELLHDGALTMLAHDQYSSGADLGLLLIGTLDTASLAKAKQEHWVRQVAALVGKIKPTIVEREALLEKALKWSGGLDADLGLGLLMHRLVAQLLYHEGNLSQARYHFMHARDGKSSALLLIEISIVKGFPGEVDLFIAHFVLEQLCLGAVDAATETFKTYCQFHPAVPCTDAPYPLPLLNFLWLLLQLAGGQCQGQRKPGAYRALCELYKPSLERDPVYKQYVQKIGRKYFDGARPEPSPYAFFDFMQQFLLEEDEEDDDEEEELPDEVD
uniref:Golgi to ER traffic protein 4 homolog n=1 Tax=Anopheles dirus TaxID=7168 RepID=A0A182NAF7_9DIPT